MTVREKRGLALVAGALMLSALCIWASAGFTRTPPPKPPEAEGMTVGDSTIALAPGAPQWKLVHVAPAKPATTHWTEPVPARVKIDESRAAKVGAPLAGRVTSVYVELGQKVKSGDPLFSVASADIAGLRAERDKSAVDLDVAKAQLGRISAMVAAHAIPAKDELEANQQLKQAEVSQRLAQAKLSSLKVSSRADNEFTVVSPRDGVVVEKNVLPSQQLSTETSLVTVADLAVVWVVAELFEADSPGINAGTAVRVTSPSLPELSVETKVDMVSAVVDPERHTVPVRVRLDNADGRLKPNIYAQMRFAIEATPSAVEIAASALVSDGSHQYVYVESNKGQFTRREIAAGPAREGRVPVMHGISPGEVVVEEGALLLDNQIALAH
jgi:cobalt-zinc-cadmium efflux system membrane fusion protein